MLNSNITLTEPPNLSSILTSDTDYNGYDISCFGLFDGSVTALLDGGVSPYGLLWDNGQTSSSMSNLSAGQYQLTVTDFNGCVLLDSIVLQEPLELSSSIESLTDYNGFDISCIGLLDGAISLSVSGSVPPYDFAWNTGEASQNIVNVPAGEYSVSITDDNGCSDFQDIILTEPSAFTSSLSSSDYNGYDISCYNNNDGWIDFTLGGSVSPYSYSWSGPNGFQDASEDISNLFVGTYVLNVVDANGCVYSNSLRLKQPEGVFAQIQTRPDTCNRGVGFAELVQKSGGVPPITVDWGNNPNTLINSGLFSGQKSVTLIDGNSCVYEISYVIENLEKPDADFWSSSYEYDVFDQLESPIKFYDSSTDNWTQIISWWWDLGDQTTYYSKNINHSYDSIGNYLVRLIVENEYQCTDTIEKVLTIKGYKMYIPNTFTPNNDNVNDVFKPVGIGVDFFDMKVYDRWGKEIHHSNDLNKGWDGSFHDKIVQIGVYVYKILTIDIFGNEHHYTGEIHLLK